MIPIPTGNGKNSDAIEKSFSRLPKHILTPNPEIYLSDNYLVLDWETTNTDFGDCGNKENNIICGAWGSKGRYVCKFGNEYDFGELLDEIEKVDFIVAHNSRFELGWLRRCGLEPEQVLSWCTMLAEHVAAGNRQWKLSLKECAKRRGLSPKEDLVSALISNGINPLDIRRRWLKRYCIQDVRTTEQLFLVQRTAAVDRDLLRTTWSRNVFVNPLLDIEQRGIQLDSERVRRVSDTLKSRLNDLETELRTFGEDVNFSSTKQRATLIYRTLKFAIPRDDQGRHLVTDKGLPKTDKEALGRLRPKTREQKRFLDILKERNSVQSKLTKYVSAFHSCVQEAGGLLKANILQHTTQTHRTSSRGRQFRAQLQNLDREFKPLFTSREGFQIGEADASQLEWRVAVELGKDRQGYKDILDGMDQHSLTAEVIFGNAFKQATGNRRKDIRTEAKSHTFKPLYGGESGTRNEQRYYKEFRKRYPGLAETQRSWVNTVLWHKQLRIPTGLLFYWDAEQKLNGKVTYQNQIYNYPIQSVATADIIPLSVTYMWHLMKALGMKSKVVNTVHDSVISEVAEGEEDLWKVVVDFCFTDVIYWLMKVLHNIDWKTPLKADTSLSQHWADTPEWRDKWLK
jgi:DNA polymerase I-like protein with 3'-5' exonuclease and polymerase domains